MCLCGHYNAEVPSEIPESVRKYAEMAYTAASAKIDDDHERKIDDLRESLGKGARDCLASADRSHQLLN